MNDGQMYLENARKETDQRQRCMYIARAYKSYLERKSETTHDDIWEAIFTDEQIPEQLVCALAPYITYLWVWDKGFVVLDSPSSTKAEAVLMGLYNLLDRG